MLAGPAAGAPESDASGGFKLQVGAYRDRDQAQLRCAQKSSDRQRFVIDTVNGRDGRPWFLCRSAERYPRAEAEERARRFREAASQEAIVVAVPPPRTAAAPGRSDIPPELRRQFEAFLDRPQGREIDPELRRQFEAFLRERGEPPPDAETIELFERFLAQHPDLLGDTSTGAGSSTAPTPRPR